MLLLSRRLGTIPVVLRLPASSRTPVILLLFSLALLLFPSQTRAQEETTETRSSEFEQGVAIEPLAQDQAIESRLQRILEASKWFQAIDVEVSEGIAFLEGTTRDEEHRDWAGNLARTTQDVVAVVNRIQVRPELDWTFRPAREEIERLVQQGQRFLPVLALVTLVLICTWGAARIVASLTRAAFRTKMRSPLLLTVFARTVAFPVVVLGVYLVLQFSGLTRLALTLLGGTGLFGLVLGFAFRDIAENFLASILLSIRNPFRMGNLVRIGEHEGIVLNLNTRSTMLATLDGNHVQIPNATVYKTVITNYSSGTSRRSDFTIGIGYDDDTAKAQSTISSVLDAHSAVMRNPQPLVLVDQLASSTVNLRVYFWFDSQSYSPSKLRSALMRKIKTALTDQGISMPDEAREVIFPRGVPILQVPHSAEAEQPPQRLRPFESESVDLDSSSAEGGLSNEDIAPAADVELAPEAQENLLANLPARTAQKAPPGAAA